MCFQASGWILSNGHPEAEFQPAGLAALLEQIFVCETLWLTVFVIGQTNDELLDLFLFFVRRSHLQSTNTKQTKISMRTDKE